MNSFIQKLQFSWKSIQRTLFTILVAFIALIGISFSLFGFFARWTIQGAWKEMIMPLSLHQLPFYTQPKTAFLPLPPQCHFILWIHISLVFFVKLGLHESSGALASTIYYTSVFPTALDLFPRDGCLCFLYLYIYPSHSLSLSFSVYNSASLATFLLLRCPHSSQQHFLYQPGTNSLRGKVVNRLVLLENCDQYGMWPAWSQKPAIEQSNVCTTEYF